MSDKLKEIIKRWKESHEKDGKLEPYIIDIILDKPYNNKNESKIETTLKYTNVINKIPTKKEIDKLQKDILKSYKKCTKFMKSYKKYK